MIQNNQKSVIIGFGHALPSYQIDNHYFEGFLDTTDSWIKSRTGISKRQFALPALGETNVTLSTQAAKNAIASAGINVSDIDFIIGGTLSSDETMPSMACRVQAALGLKDIFAFDLSAACSGFLFGLGVADRFLKSGTHKTGLVIGTEILSSFINLRDRSTAVLFGDGSGAAIIQSCEGEDIPSFWSEMASDGNYADLLWIPAGNSKIPPTDPTFSYANAKVVMRGNELFKVAVRCMKQSILKCLEKSGTTIDQIDLLVTHQANERIIDKLQEELGFPKEKVVKKLEFVGNTSAASIPIACSMAAEEKQLTSGSLVMSASFGGGLNYGACLFPVRFKGDS
jgi:3-oxoacyl-[acyl-carrier-protein] synthase III